MPSVAPPGVLPFAVTTPCLTEERPVCSLPSLSASLSSPAPADRSRSPPAPRTFAAPSWAPCASYRTAPDVMSTSAPVGPPQRAFPRLPQLRPAICFLDFLSFPGTRRWHLSPWWALVLSTKQAARPPSGHKVGPHLLPLGEEECDHVTRWGTVKWDRNVTRHSRGWGRGLWDSGAACHVGFVETGDGASCSPSPQMRTMRSGPAGTSSRNTYWE